MKIHMTGLCLSALLLASPYALAADKPAEPAKTEVKADSKADTPKTEAAAELPTPPKEEVVAALGAAEKVLGEAKKAGVLWFVPFTAIKNIPNDDGVTNYNTDEALKVAKEKFEAGDLATAFSVAKQVEHYSTMGLDQAKHNKALPPPTMPTL